MFDDARVFKCEKEDRKEEKEANCGGKSGQCDRKPFGAIWPEEGGDCPSDGDDLSQQGEGQEEGHSHIDAGMGLTRETIEVPFILG